MTFIAGLPEVDRDEATDDRQEDKMKDPITYRVNADRLILHGIGGRYYKRRFIYELCDAGVPEGRGAVDL